MLKLMGFENPRTNLAGERTALYSALRITDNLHMQTWVIELGVVYLVLFFIDLLFFAEAGGFFAFSPHPFWLPVLLISLQYGFARAIAAAASAITLNWLFLAPEQQLGQPYFDYLIRNSITPTMWLCTALVVGELRQRQIVEQAQADDELKRLREQAEVLSKHCTDATQANLELQLKIAAGKTAPIEHALIQLGSRQSLDLQQFLTAFEEALGSLLGKHKASVFVNDDRRCLKLAFEFGWTDTDRFSRDFEIHHPLYQAVIDQAQPVSTNRSPWDSHVLQDEGAVAVPINYIHRGGAYAMLKIEEAETDLSSAEKLRALILLGREMGIFLEQFSAHTPGEMPAPEPNPEFEKALMQAAG